MKTYIIMLDTGITHIIQEFQANNPDDGLGMATDYFKSLFPDFEWDKIGLQIININWDQ